VSEVSTSSEYNLSNYNLEFSAVSWDPSDYINFTAPPVEAGHITKMFRIFIDDNDPSRNWSVHAQNYSWCTGLGTEIDPYIIENLYINGNGSAGMIYVKNSDKYFIIRDCWFNYSGPNEYDAGVVVQESANGMIVNNAFTYLHKGVTLEGCFNVTVDNNIFISDHTTAGLCVGISIGQGDSLVISNNKIRDYYFPAGMSSSVNITLSNNYIESTIWENYDGSPVFCNKVNDTSIVRNVLAGGFAFSTFEIYNSGGSGNTVINNTVISAEPLIFGPETSGVTSITPMTSQGSTGLISLTNSYNNLIAHNVMLGAGGNEGGAIHGFNIFIFMGMVGVISVLLILVKRKRR